jgi:hypothetical protein
MKPILPLIASLTLLTACHKESDSASPSATPVPDLVVSGQPFSKWAKQLEDHNPDVQLKAAGVMFQAEVASLRGAQGQLKLLSVDTTIPSATAARASAILHEKLEIMPEPSAAFTLIEAQESEPDDAMKSAERQTLVAMARNQPAAIEKIATRLLQRSTSRSFAQRLSEILIEIGQPALPVLERISPESGGSQFGADLLDQTKETIKRGGSAK